MTTFTRRSLFPAVGLGLGLGLGWFARRGATGARPGPLRPPGALDEQRFLAACIRCGQCVQACPFDVLHLAGPEAGLGTGAPTLDTRAQPCELCQGHDELLCIPACPTAALGPVAEWLDISMGTAEIDHDRCLAWQGTSCRSCWHACPFPEDAISFDWKIRPQIHADVCIGCGLCDRACLTEPSSVRIRPASRPAGEGAA